MRDFLRCHNWRAFAAAAVLIGLMWFQYLLIR